MRTKQPHIVQNSTAKAGLFTILTCPFFFAATAPACLAEPGSSATEQGTQLILDMILEQDSPVEASQTLLTPEESVARTPGILNLTETEQVVDPAMLTTEEREQLATSNGTWRNQKESMEPGSSPQEWVEPLRFRESPEELVDTTALSPAQLARFPELKMIALPVAASATEVTNLHAATESFDSTSNKQQGNLSRHQPMMPRITRWGARPSIH